MPFRPQNVTWIGAKTRSENLSSATFVCGYCGSRVASDVGWNGNIPGPKTLSLIRICPDCSGPTLLEGEHQVPGVPYGNPVKHLPDDIARLYEEARSSMAAGAPTAAVLCCRKLLMHVAVERKANEGQNFVTYVQFLEDNHFIPAGAKSWVDQIRTRGNEANHEIQIKSRPEAEEMIDFAEMLLKVIYDYPSRVPAPTT